MLTKKLIIILLGLIAIAYTLAFITSPHTYALFIPAAFLLFIIIIFLLLTDLMYALMPSKIKQKYKNHMFRFRVVNLLTISYLLLAFWVFHKYYLSNKLSFLTGIVPLIIVTLVTTFGWSLLNRNIKSAVITGVVGIFIIIYPAFAPTYNPKDSSPASSISQLKSLPYLSYVLHDKAPQKSGVVVYDKRLSSEGINIYNSFGLSGAYLLDMTGNVLHSWRPQEGHWLWHYVEMYDSTDLLVVIKDRMLMRLDWNSHVKWKRPMRFHHDIEIDQKRNIYVLARKDEMFFRFGIPVPMLNDYIIIISPNGEILKEISFYQILKDKIRLVDIFNIYHWLCMPKTIKEHFQYKIFPTDTPHDIFHINTIELIDTDIDNVFKKGSLLFCARNLDTVGVMDLEKERLIWSWGINDLERPHQPTLIENGNILIFDNGTTSRKFSRVIEFDPLSNNIVWEYEDHSPSSFYSSWGGANQRLPNGNTLITDTDKGRVFEITRDGKIVWEFYNPDKGRNGKRATIYRMVRLTNPQRHPSIFEIHSRDTELSSKTERRAQ